MAEQGFTLTSPSFQEAAYIPARHTCDGDDLSPHLDWIHPPEGTRSFTLIVDDPDAPKRTFTHWILFDIPASVRSLPEGRKGTGIPGHNDFQFDGYGGPCPPANHGDHRYFISLYAVDVESLDLKQGARRADVEQALQGHVLDLAQLMGRYRRRTGTL